MRKLLLYFRRFVVVFGLCAMVFVLFPKRMEPLWAWAKSTVSETGRDFLPSFDVAQDYSGFLLLGVTVLGVVYLAWRDRRYEVLRAEYTTQSGAAHLKRQVKDLENRLRQATNESRRWKDAHAALAGEHATALVTSKEHEVRSEFGKEDRDSLKKLREQFEVLLAEKGHADGFRKAMEIMMVNLRQQSAVNDGRASTVEEASHAMVHEHRRLSGDQLALPQADKA